MRDLQSEFENLTGQTAPRVNSGAPGAAPPAGDPATTDPEIVRMHKTLAELDAKITASRTSADKLSTEARKQLDDAMDAFNKRVAAAQDMMGASPELIRYVTAAQKMQDATRKITNELIQSQQDSVSQITESRRSLESIYSNRRADRIKNDVELKQMKEQLQFAERQLNAANGSADSQLVDQAKLNELRGSMEILKAQIESRQEQVGEDRFDREATAVLESLIAQSQKRMDDNRKKYEGILDGLAKEFSGAAPAAEQMSAEQKRLIVELSQGSDQLSGARKQYSDAINSATGAEQKKLDDAALDLKSRIDARATELTDASNKTNASRAEQERILRAEQKQKELAAAKVMSLQAETTLKKAKDDLYDLRKLTDQASKANDQIAQHSARLTSVTGQLKLQQAAFEAKQKEAARSVAPRRPEPRDVEVIENYDPRPTYSLLAVALTCVVYAGLIARVASAQPATPTAPPVEPVNGNGVNGNRLHTTARRDDEEDAEKTEKAGV